MMNSDFFPRNMANWGHFFTKSSMTCFFGHHLEKIHQEKKRWVVVIFSFHFLMLRHWIASPEGFSIKW